MIRELVGHPTNDVTRSLIGKTVRGPCFLVMASALPFSEGLIAIAFVGAVFQDTLCWLWHLCLIHFTKAIAPTLSMRRRWQRWRWCQCRKRRGRRDGQQWRWCLCGEWRGRRDGQCRNSRLRALLLVRSASLCLTLCSQVHVQFDARDEALRGGRRHWKVKWLGGQQALRSRVHSVDEPRLKVLVVRLFSSLALAFDVVGNSASVDHRFGKCLPTPDVWRESASSAPEALQAVGAALREPHDHAIVIQSDLAIWLPPWPVHVDTLRVTDARDEFQLVVHGRRCGSRCEMIFNLLHLLEPPSQVLLDGGRISSVLADVAVKHFVVDASLRVAAPLLYLGLVHLVALPNPDGGATLPRELLIDHARDELGRDAFIVTRIVDKEDLRETEQCPRVFRMRVFQGL
mmetsp:Transcript_7619/g.20824  ORF Transcript_7619/g.20824 Transcript_7619/m.20824 type:complete len:401 (-) Transcript_7619:2787-3989(-)